MSIVKHAKYARGFTLIEVLVALVVLSIGLLGLAGLQLLGVKNTNNAYLRTQATLLADGLAERMRVNRPAVHGSVVDRDDYSYGAYDNSYAVIDSNGIDCEDDFPNPYCEASYSGSSAVAAAACNPAQMAAFDAYVISCGVGPAPGIGGIDDLLPAGRLQVQCNDADTVDADTCSQNSSYTIIMGWTEVEQTRTGNGQVSKGVRVTVFP